jgi:radical SAM protein with 4Fe4S-binding SPASM domain
MQKIKFRFKGDHIDSFAKLGQPRAIFLDVTNRCNFSCKYCFNHRALQTSPLDLEPEIIHKALHSKLAEPVKDWFLSGGEPALYRHLAQAFELFRERGIGPKIATNGSRLTPEVLDSWIRSGVKSVQFSLDTLKPELHPYLNGGDSRDHDKILRHLEHAIRSPIRVVVSSVLTQTNKHEIKDIMTFCFVSGVDSYTLYPNVPTESLYRELIVPFPAILDLTDELFDAYRTLCPTKTVDLTMPCFSASSSYAKWKDTIAIRLHYCAAAQYALKITSDGRVSACICQDSDPFIIGDLHLDTLDDIWNSERAVEFRSLYKKIPECSLCEQKDLCRGGCRNNSVLLGSDGMYSLDPYCRYFKSQQA